MAKNSKNENSPSASPETNENLIKLTTRSYDEAAERFHDCYYSPDKIHETASVRLGLISFVKRLPKKGVVLDIGSGPGVHLDFIKRSTRLEVIGIDLSMGMLRFARHQYPEAKLVRMDVRNLSIRNSCCDGIWSSCLVHHIPKAEVPLFIHELYRIAKPGCLVYIITERGSSEGIEESAGQPYLIGPRFVSALEVSEIREITEDAGFKVMNIKVSDEDLIHLIARKQ